MSSDILARRERAKLGRRAFPLLARGDGPDGKGKVDKMPETKEKEAPGKSSAREKSGVGLRGSLGQEVNLLIQ